MTIYIDVNDLDVGPLELTRHERFAENLLRAANESNAELSVSLVTDHEIQRLNRKYRGKDIPTDVLSFSMREGQAIGQPGQLGDIVISVDTAARQAESLGHSLADEIDELLLHGLLHLQGYDHEKGRETDWYKAQENLLDRLREYNLSFIPRGISELPVHKINE